ncbi:hypothetical protein AOC23_06100 [Polynucleobacter paneuropaeus]|uniref:hypothetical protein n=1 Tax=Polynucleobacter paneuropaeus TaxID=2527775 RepID=UPI001BFEABF0|nr:hypothetical protein [Polynucleobacter paneuropaeus]MBT8631642.1 hypothetical protein [Polynucleobacter paneuropaeus]
MIKPRLKLVELVKVPREDADGNTELTFALKKPKRPDLVKRNESDVNKNHVIAQLVIYNLEHPNALKKNIDADVCNIINAMRDKKKKKVTVEVIKDIRQDYERYILQSEQLDNGEIPDVYELADKLFNNPTAKKIARKAK